MKPMQTIIHGDARELSPDINFDVMLTDPPYRRKVHRNAVSMSSRGVKTRNLGFDHLSAELRRYTARLAARAKRWSCIYSDVESLAWWRISLQAAGAQYIRTVPWIRWSMPQLSGDRPPTGFEPITIAYGSQGGRKSWNGPGNLTHFAHTALRGEGKHKTEKPLDQMLDLVAWFSQEGETVLDPYAGRGTTALACKILGRSFIGYEIDAEECDKANERLFAPGLSERDLERFLRWVGSVPVQEKEKARMQGRTSSVRAKMEAAK